MRRPSPDGDARPPESAVARRHRDPVAAIQCGATDVPASGNGRREGAHTLGSCCRRLTAGPCRHRLRRWRHGHPDALVLSVARTGMGGMVRQPLGGTRTATMILFRSGLALTGFWTILEADGPASGNLTGTIGGSTALLMLRPRARSRWWHSSGACGLRARGRNATAGRKRSAPSYSMAGERIGPPSRGYRLRSL